MKKRRKKKKSKAYLQKQYDPPSVDQNYSSTSPGGGAHATCSAEKNTRIPCDVDKLTLIDQTDGQSVTCSRHMFDEPPEGEPSERMLSDLRSYDLVFERLADYENRRREAETSVKLQIDPKHFGSCPQDKHPFVELTGGEVDEKWVLSSPTTVKLLALPEAHPNAAAWLAPFWLSSSQGINELTVIYQSCAVRFSGEVKTEYRALVRIYPKDLYTLTFTLPPLKSWKGKRSASVDLNSDFTVKKSKSKSSEVFGEEQSSSSTETEDSNISGTHLETTTEGGRDGEEYRTVSETKGTKDFADYHRESESVSESHGKKGLGSHEVTVTESSDSPKLKLKKATKIDVTVKLKKNDQELNITKVISTILNIVSIITKGIEDLKNFKPKVGWDISFELAVFEGSVSGSWGRRDTAEASGGGRYVAVEPFYTLKFALTLFSFKLTLMAGLEFKVGEWYEPSLELTAKIEGSLSCEVPLGGEYSSAEPDPKLSLEGIGKGKIGGYGRATIWGHHLLDMSVEVEGGLKFTGEFHISVQHAPHVTAKMERLVTELTLICRFNDGKEKPAKTKLFDGADLWSGYLPSHS